MYVIKSVDSECVCLSVSVHACMHMYARACMFVSVCGKKSVDCDVSVW